MLALRRACNPIKKGLGGKAYRLVQAPLEVCRCNLDGQSTGLDESVLVVSGESRLGARGYCSANDSQKLFRGARSFSSNTRSLSSGDEARSGDEDDDLSEGFSDLEASTDVDALEKRKAHNDLVSEDELSGDDTVDLPEDELNLVDMGGDGKEETPSRKRVHSELFKVISAAKFGENLNDILDKWVEEGNEVTGDEISAAMLNLRKRRLYHKALQLSEWLETSKHIEFSEREYASRVDLVAKVHGPARAEIYMNKIPQDFRTEVVYRTLLANHISTPNINLKKAEAIFNKMKDLGFPVTSFACNQLLILYKKMDKRKIADILSLMETEDIKPSPFTYKILIDSKGQSNDIHGMEQIVETMKAEGLVPDNNTLAIIARHYTSALLPEKAEAVLKEMEGNDLQENRFALHSLISLYAALGKDEEVRRIWQACDSNPRLDECMAAIEAWGKLKKVEEAEAIYEKMTTKWLKLSAKHYAVLLKVYADNKMLAKGKVLVKQMADKGISIGPLAWDAIVKLYAEAGEVEKADSVLQKVSEQSRSKPMFNTFTTLLENYANKGDVHNAEKIFQRMRQAGYLHRLRQFQTLLKAYSKSGTHPYGFIERLKGDNVFPNRGIQAELSLLDPFKKTAASDLID